jgi:hypothetical protein
MLATATVRIVLGIAGGATRLEKITGSVISRLILAENPGPSLFPLQLYFRTEYIMNTELLKLAGQITGIVRLSSLLTIVLGILATLLAAAAPVSFAGSNGTNKSLESTSNVHSGETVTGKATLLSGQIERP